MARPFRDLHVARLEDAHRSLAGVGELVGDERVEPVLGEGELDEPALCRLEVEDLRPAPALVRPGTGVVRLWCEMVNQHDEIVQAGEDVMLVAARFGAGQPES